MSDPKLEDLVGEIAPTGEKKVFNVKPYLNDFVNSVLSGAIVGAVRPYFHLFSPEPSPLSFEDIFILPAVATGASCLPPLKSWIEQEYLKTNQSVWGGRFTRFAGVFTGVSLAYYLSQYLK
ncbi:MAG: hypothetical protein AABX13_05665 [Nanoarchaeota archaeon]